MQKQEKSKMVSNYCNYTTADKTSDKYKFSGPKTHLSFGDH